MFIILLLSAKEKVNYDVNMVDQIICWSKQTENLDGNHGPVKQQLPCKTMPLSTIDLHVNSHKSTIILTKRSKGNDMSGHVTFKVAHVDEQILR